jgi:hypothetical protein
MGTMPRFLASRPPRRGRLQRFGVVALAVVAMPAVVLGLQSAASASPAIASVVVGGTQVAPSITVNGTGFGTSAAALGTAYGIPTSTCGIGNTGKDYADNFKFNNDTRNWEAGRGTNIPGDNCIGVLFTSYTNTQIVFTLGSNFTSQGYQLLAGDAFTMTVLGTVFTGQAPRIVPANIAPAGTTITPGQRAAWTFSITNPYDNPLTSGTATFKVLANDASPVTFDFTAMPGCVLDEGGGAVCPLPAIAPHSSTTLSAVVRSDGLGEGTTISGSVRVDASAINSQFGTLGTVLVTGCGSACVTGAATPGDPISSQPGPTTNANPTKQIVTLPDVAGGPPVAVTLKSVNPGPTTSTPDKQLCPTIGNKCGGQISVIGGDFSKYKDRAHPIRIQIVMHWTKPIPKGRILMTKLVGPPITLPKCAKKNGLYNTPCAGVEVVSGSLARNNLTTSDLILFVGTDPHIGRRVSNVPDAPLTVKALTGKKSATVTWKPPIVTNGAITGYVVTPHLGRILKNPIVIKGTAIKKVVGGLVTGKSYTFTVQAKNAHGISFASLPSKAIKIK